MPISEVFSVKVPEELRERIRSLMDASGMQGKDFMEEIVKLYELHTAKKLLPTVAGDVEELQAITRRISEIFLSLVERDSTLMRDREANLQGEIDTKNKAISLIQERLDAVTAQLEALKTEQERMNQLKAERERLQQREKDLEAEKLSMQKQHALDLQQAQLEKEKSLLELREKHQSQLEQLSAEYRERVKTLLPDTKSPHQQGRE
jgi:DNA repair exonuclease SbcCD ATPase subunit